MPNLLKERQIFQLSVKIDMDTLRNVFFRTNTEEDDSK